MGSLSSERRRRDKYRSLFIENPTVARSEVLSLWEGRIGTDGRNIVEAALTDIENLFAGRVNGFKASNTPYHTLGHSIMVFVAMARILDGAVRSATALEPNDIVAGLLAAIYHDTGYIQDSDDTDGTGAKHTVGHEERSSQQLVRFLAGFGAHASLLRTAGAAILHTDVRGDLPQDSDTAELHDSPLGEFLMFADIYGQMADRAYVEKLLYLYIEFRDAGFTNYSTEMDVLAGTARFYRDVVESNKSAGEVSRLLSEHFAHRLGVANDLYGEYIRKNLSYLSWLLDNHSHDYRDYLRRSSIVSRLSDAA